ncbi:MAG: hypothetical protein FWD70_03830, partial [Desulfuromonadales bacterium]|nr:hypothetical protein [Desulfuromonadales bacterium]
MKTWKLLVVACMTAFLFGCGGGGGGDNSGTDEPPTISNAFISPAVATYYQGGGTINVNLTMKFTDSGGNVKSFTLNIYDVNNSQLSTNTYPISGISGVTNGTISGVVTIPTTTIGNYTWKIFVTDAASHKSNILNGSFDIITSQMTQSSATA